MEILKYERTRVDSCLNRLILAISGLIVLLLPIFVAGCGGDDDEMDITKPVTTKPPSTRPPGEDTTPPDVVERPPKKEEPKISFRNDVFPIFQANCNFAGCHAANPPSGLKLTSYDDFKKGGRGGPAFVPKKSRSSLIVKRIDGGGMPLNRPRLKKEEIQLIKDWIDEGGEDN